MSEIKICTKCKKEKLKTEFYNQTKGKDGRRGNCKSCCMVAQRKHRNKNRKLYNKKIAIWRKNNPQKVRAARKRWNANRVRLNQHLISKYKGISCMDCKGVFPWCVMDFDHRPKEKKEFNIGQFCVRTPSKENISKVEKEIAKCDLVCSNCHRIRTHITRKK